MESIAERHDPRRQRNRERWTDGDPQPDADGGQDLTISERFARSMSIDDALDPRNLLCYEMNGEPLPHKNGFPVRLIAPGWYGVANVKWLTRIEVRDQRHAGNFMARDYVTIREEQRDGQPFWTSSTVRHDRLKSAPAKVARREGRYVVLGAAWGAPIAAVEVRIDDGPWMPASLLGPRHVTGTCVALPGDSGRLIGGHLPQVSTGSLRGHSTWMAICNQRRPKPSSPAGERSGRATDTSRARFSSRDSDEDCDRPRRRARSSCGGW